MTNLPKQQTVNSIQGAQTVISFVPQYSVHKDIFKNLHNENWNLWRDSIPLIKYKTADCSQIDNVREYIFHGQNKSDMPHAEKFQKRANRIHLVFKDTDHNLSLIHISEPTRPY